MKWRETLAEAESNEREALALRAQAQKILDSATESLSKEDEERFDSLTARADELDERATKQRDLAAKAEANEKRIGAARREPAPSPSPSSGPITTRESIEDDPSRGFRSADEFFRLVLRPREARSDIRMRFLATAGSDEQSGVHDAYGGYLVPESFSNALIESASAEDPIAGMTTQIPMETPVVRLPALSARNRTSSVSGGFRVYRRAETQAATASRAQIELVKLEAHPKTGLVHVTDEIMEDSPSSIAAIIESGFAAEFAAMRLNERIRGTGVGEWLGVLNAASLVGIARAGNGTIAGTDLLKARARCKNYGRAVWLANPDTLPGLAAAHIGGTDSDVFLFSPARGLDVPDMLLGRPIFFTDFCETYGTKGDIILADWQMYLEGYLRGSSPRRMDSIHVRFAENEHAIRFTMRDAGGPWWSAAETPKKGNDTLSPFVVINTYTG